jgi:hypothetical protein
MKKSLAPRMVDVSVDSTIFSSILLVIGFFSLGGAVCSLTAALTALTKLLRWGCSLTNLWMSAIADVATLFIVPLPSFLSSSRYIM